MSSKCRLVYNNSGKINALEVRGIKRKNNSRLSHSEAIHDLKCHAGILVMHYA